MEKLNRINIFGLNFGDEILKKYFIQNKRNIMISHEKNKIIRDNDIINPDRIIAVGDKKIWSKL